MRRITFFFLVMMGLIFTQSAFAADKLVVAIQPTSTPEQLSSQSKEIKAMLEKSLGMEVEVLFPTSYAGVIEALHYGHAQVAFMGSWPAMIATIKADAKVILAENREVFIDHKKTEAAYYYSYWVVNKDSKAQSLADLKGMRAAFPSQLSSSGYVAPLSRLVELNYATAQDGLPADPKQYFGQVMYAGGYAQGFEALKGGQVDVTVIAGDVAEKLYNEVLDNTRVVETQGPIPSHTIVVSKDVDAALSIKIQNAFLEFNKPEYQPLMRKFVSGIFVKFVPADETHLASLKRMVELTKLEFAEKK
jgi:phosphonate transport system substrate-binding protein